ncbi:hypothetical protein CYMTET_42788 [Cymbomonas tetramitiformis]|uniref:Uncharacterized protein n=1 Tax=Cymbomonas tetramitiformis TaxID=36881 RepID=A0AAE0C3K2_9CHLO|nr:hypothetical protein CYMTET_42788 [Cymbomonas tetramitiformis]
MRRTRRVRIGQKVSALQAVHAEMASPWLQTKCAAYPCVMLKRGSSVEEEEDSGRGFAMGSCGAAVEDSGREPEAGFADEAVEGSYRGVQAASLC